MAYWELVIITLFNKLGIGDSSKRKVVLGAEFGEQKIRLYLGNGYGDFWRRETHYVTLSL